VSGLGVISARLNAFAGIATPSEGRPVKISKTPGEQPVAVQFFGDYPDGKAARATFFTIFDKPLDGCRQGYDSSHGHLPRRRRASTKNSNPLNGLSGNNPTQITRRPGSIPRRALGQFRRHFSYMLETYGGMKATNYLHGHGIFSTVMTKRRFLRRCCSISRSRAVSCSESVLMPLEKRRRSRALLKASEVL
jgi:hypothetical protein